MEGDEFNEPMHTNERVRQNLLTSSTYKCVFIRSLIVYQKRVNRVTLRVRSFKPE